MFKSGIFSILLSASLHAQSPLDEPTVIFVADGDAAEYSLTSNIPANWYEPDASLDWETASAGFGGTDRASEVSTVTYFSAIRLRQRFDLDSTPETLKLSLKQDEADLKVYLNGVAVLDLQSDQLPPLHSTGHRHYDLSTHIPLLTPTGNLLAIYSQGSILTPVLYGTNSDTTANPIAVDPIHTRLVEGRHALAIRVFRQSPTSSSTRLFLSPSSTGTASTSDFLVTLNGEALPLISNLLGRYFEVPFSGLETEKIVKLEIADDIHAEGEELIAISSNGQETRFIISRNDMVVTRTTEQGEGSLRQAIENAELSPGIETISFSDAEGVPFSQAPVTVHLEDGSPGRYGLREGFVIEGPASPGRVTIQANGGPLFYISGAGGAATTQNLTLRRLVIQGSSLVLESLRYAGTILIEDCEFIENERVLEIYSRSSQAMVRRCLFANNTETCIYQRNGLAPRIENCTFAFNPSTNLNGTSNVESCTFVSDSTRFASSGPAFKNCLFSGVGSDISYRSSDFDQGGNLFAGTLRGDTPLTPPHPDSLAVNSSSAGIGELGFHGGFTRTIPILSDSPALDLGLLSEEDSPDYDQRGQPYLRRVGLAPDAGAYELQLANDALTIGLTTAVSYDLITGLYFQFALIHNLSPWTINGFQLHVSGLPADAFLYNSTEEGVIDVSGPFYSSDYRIVVLQYSASRPDLLLSPQLSLNFDSSVVDPYQPFFPRPELSIDFDGSSSPCLTFRTEPGEEYQVQVSENTVDWHPKGPPIISESDHLIWRDPDTSHPTKLYYRVSSSN